MFLHCRPLLYAGSKQGKGIHRRVDRYEPDHAVILI